MEQQLFSAADNLIKLPCFGLREGAQLPATGCSHMGQGHEHTYGEKSKLSPKEIVKSLVRILCNPLSGSVKLKRCYKRLILTKDFFLSTSPSISACASFPKINLISCTRALHADAHTPQSSFMKRTQLHPGKVHVEKELHPGKYVIQD